MIWWNFRNDTNKSSSVSDFSHQIRYKVIYFTLFRHKKNQKKRYISIILCFFLAFFILSTYQNRSLALEIRKSSQSMSLPQSYKSIFRQESLPASLSQTNPLKDVPFLWL